MLRDLPSIAATTCILGLSLFGLPLAVSQTASAETAAQHKGCRIDAKTGRPVPSRIASNESPRSGRKVTRVPCPSPAQSAEQKTVPALENVWLDAGALLLKAPPPVAGGWWVKGEALVWSVKSAPLPPTLTTFAPGSLSAITGAGGDVGVAGTTILSPDNMRFDPLAGGRFTLGHWLDPNQSLGVEGAGFFLGSRNAGFSETSGGAPPLRVPFTNVPPGAGFPLGNSSFVLADPGVAAGGQVISSSLQFWGAEGNAIFHAFNARTVNVSLLAGVRYLNLSEGLTIASTETLLPPFAGNTFTGTDSFGTRNQFFGGQVGAKAETQYGRFDGSLLGKLAFGDNYQTVSVNGSSAVSGFGFPPGSVTPGGIFA